MRADIPILSARISPDGRLIAYQSTETAESPKQGIYVRTLDLAAGKTGETAQQVKGDPSFGMGLGVTWRQDGRELYYLAPKHAVMAVDVTASPGCKSERRGCSSGSRPTTHRGSASRNGARRAAGRGGSAEGSVAARGPISQLAILDRQGKVLQRVGPAGRYGQPALTGRHRIATRPIPSRGGRSDIGSWTSPGRTADHQRRAAGLPDVVAGRQADQYVSARRVAIRGSIAKRHGTGDAEFIYRYDPVRPESAGHLPDGTHLLFNSGGSSSSADGRRATRKAIELSREEFW
jgi:hypothetical protein